MKVNIKTIANIIIVLLIGVFFVRSLLFYKPKETVSLDDQRDCLFEKQILEIVLKTNILYEGAKLNDLSLLDRNSQSFNLSSILDTIPSLFLYAPLEGCDICVEGIYDLIKKYATLKNNDIKVYLLVKSPNFRSFIASQVEEESNIKSLYIKEGWLGLDIEKLDTPFLFLTDNTLYANRFFLIDKNIIDINRFYIESIFAHF